MKRIYYSLLCLLALVQVGIAQTKEIKTQVGGTLFLPEEISRLLGYSPDLMDQVYQAEYYELVPKDDVLGVKERVLHGRFFAKYPKDKISIQKLDSLIISGEYRDGKMVGRWFLEDMYVDIEDDKPSYTIDETLTSTIGSYERSLTRKVKVVKGVAQDTIYLCQKEAHDGKPLVGVREIIVPLDSSGWAHGLVIDRIQEQYEYRYHYYHGFLIASATIELTSGKTSTHTAMDKATFEKEFDPATGEITQELPDGAITRYKRVPSYIAGKLDQGRWNGLLGGNLLIYPALCRAFADTQQIEVKVPEQAEVSLFNTPNN